MKYEGIGFNAEHLSKFSYRDFAKEVKHHFKGDERAGEKMRELYGLIKAKFPDTKQDGEAQ